MEKRDAVAATLQSGEMSSAGDCAAPRRDGATRGKRSPQVNGARTPEPIPTSQLGMRGEELCGGRAEAVAFRRLGDCASPPHGQSSVEPFRTPVHAARTLGAGEKPSTGFLGPMAPMQHPSDTNVVVVFDAPREDRAPCQASASSSSVTAISDVRFLVSDRRRRRTTPSEWAGTLL